MDLFGGIRVFVRQLRGHSTDFLGIPLLNTIFDMLTLLILNFTMDTLINEPINFEIVRLSKHCNATLLMTIVLETSAYRMFIKYVCICVLQISRFLSWKVDCWSRNCHFSGLLTGEKDGLIGPRRSNTNVRVILIWSNHLPLYIADINFIWS